MLRHSHFAVDFFLTIRYKRRKRRRKIQKALGFGEIEINSRRVKPV